jgi:hypothetical protein
VGQETLYQNVVAPYCRACHILRGTANMSAINFMLYDYDRTLDPTDTVKDDFRGYADRIKAHVIDRGNMPLGLLIYERFWSSTAPETLADFLEGEGYTVRCGRAGRSPIRDRTAPCARR